MADRHGPHYRQFFLPHHFIPPHGLDVIALKTSCIPAILHSQNKVKMAESLLQDTILRWPNESLRLRQSLPKRRQETETSTVTAHIL
jgi:hypothetical protein